MRGMTVWQMRQANECPCGGSDEYCPCQNIDKMAQADREVEEILREPGDFREGDIEKCPFCAQNVIGPIPTSRSDKWDFHCRGCGCVVELSAPNAELAVRNYNTRATK